MSLPVHDHTKVVADIARQLAEAAKARDSVHLYKGGVSHFVPVPGDQRRKGRAIDISMLHQVLEIDSSNCTCTAEPGVTFSALVKETLKHGMIPMVVPELEGITLGGAVAGCSVESMSYRYGGFHDSCIEYEVITTSGEIVHCSRENNHLNFEMLHGSYGTLGILTRIKFRLVPALPFVKMEYRTFDRFDDFEKVLLELCNAKNPSYSFIDGIAHAKDYLVLCLGNFVNSTPYVSSYRGTEIYYKSTISRKEDYLSTIDYCFRYDTECHWLSRAIPPLEWKPIRALFGKYFLGSTNMIRWSKRMDSLLKLKKRPDVVCDVFIPQNRFKEFFSWYAETFNFFPLWIVPYRVPQFYGWVSEKHKTRMTPEMPDKLLIDCAVYGKPNSEPMRDFSQLLESKTTELAGVKTLISKNHFSPTGFWDVFHRDNYLKAKSALDPAGLFPDIYEKFHRQ